MKSISLDTEATGLDTFHDCRPFFVTIGLAGGGNLYWDWDVDPLTRMPKIPAGDLAEITTQIESADKVVFQNAKFDLHALASVGLRWQWWDKIEDTLLAGHLIASGEPHDLTSMAAKYLAVDIKPWEDRLTEACKESRKVVKRDYKAWRIATDKDDGLPSAKGSEKLHKWDMWLPKALAIEQKLPRGECQIVNCKATSKFDLMIDRTTKWGNPFVIGRDGTREEVIEKYERRLISTPSLLQSLPEIDGKICACHCKPLPCHGDVLQRHLLARFGHPYWSVLREYSNTDSTVTLALWDVQKRILEDRGLWNIYLERRKLIRVIYEMECRGVTVSQTRLDELYNRFAEEVGAANTVLINMAKSMGHDLVLPKSGNNKSLIEFAKAPTGLNLEERGLKADADMAGDLLGAGGSKQVNRNSIFFTDKGAVSLNKNAIAYYLNNTPLPKQAEKWWRWLDSFSKKRVKDTALSYMGAYKRFGLLHSPGWLRLHPSINATGTAHLRMSSERPNEQNISKQGYANLRYVFGPAPGREWWSLDYENIELRIPAFESGEEEMVALFERPDDPPYYGSVHLLMFDTLHPDLFAQHGAEVKTLYKDTWYQWTKNGDFAVQYGAMEESGTADRAYHVVGAQHRIQSRFQRIEQLNRDMIDLAQKQGYITTLPDKTIGNVGYPIECPFMWGKVRPTVPLNYHVSGTAMWCMCKAMVRCQDYVDTLPNHYIVMQVHDEMVFDFPKSKIPGGNFPKVLKLKRLMEESGRDIGVPLTVSYAYHPNNWSVAEEIPNEDAYLAAAA